MKILAETKRYEVRKREPKCGYFRVLKTFFPEYKYIEKTNPKAFFGLLGGDSYHEITNRHKAEREQRACAISVGRSEWDTEYYKREPMDIKVVVCTTTLSGQSWSDVIWENGRFK